MNASTPHPKNTCAIGVDVGGTKIAAGIVDPQGRVMEKRLISTLPARGGEAVLHDALALAEALRDEAFRRQWNPVALGVGVCELVDACGLVRSSHTIQWRGLPVLEQFARLAPAILEADSRAAAFCEARCGAGKAFDSFFYVTVGTGIGSSLVLHGRPFTGANGCTGELASAPMRVLHPESGALTGAVLEKTASGPALVARYNQQTGARLLRAEEVLSAAAGNSIASVIVETAAISLGATIALLVNVLAPEAVIVGGGLGAAPGLYWERLEPAIRAHIWSEVNRGLPILQAACGGNAGFIGAALLALEKQKTNEPLYFRNSQ